MMMMKAAEENHFRSLIWPITHRHLPPRAAISFSSRSWYLWINWAHEEDGGGSEQRQLRPMMTQIYECTQTL
jgi:hypothetical protein